MGNAKDKFCLQISEKPQEKETGSGCIANNTFGKHSEEEQMVIKKKKKKSSALASYSEAREAASEL